MAIIFLRNGLYHKVPIKSGKSLKSFQYNGHKYGWDEDRIFRLLGWYPWQVPSLNPFKFFYQWLERRYVSVGLVLYREPADPLHAVELAEPPLAFSDYVVKGYDRVSPALFRGAILSPLYKRYEKATKFAGITDKKTIIIIIAVFIVAMVGLRVMGVI
jgi:hypothetical protein